MARGCGEGRSEGKLIFETHFVISDIHQFQKFSERVTWTGSLSLLNFTIVSFDKQPLASLYF